MISKMKSTKPCSVSAARSSCIQSKSDAVNDTTCKAEPAIDCGGTPPADVPTLFVGVKEVDGKRDVGFSRGQETLLQSRICVESPAERAGFLDNALAGHPAITADRIALDAQIVEMARITDRGLEAASEVHTSRPTPGGASASAQLVELMSGADLFHTQDGRAYATVPTPTGNRTMPIAGDQFKKYLTGRYYETHNKPPTSQAKTEAIESLEAEAIFRGRQDRVFVRYAEHGGRYYVDLADEAGTCIEIGPNGWTECPSPPVKFVRPASTLPLPKPQHGGSLKLLQKYVNVADRDWPLLVGYVMAAALPVGPYPILVLQGEQGTAKSTSMRMIANIVDPRVAGQRSDIRSLDDLQIAAANSHLLSFDNLSYLRDDVSDAICRISTGSGSAKRRLYTDCDEVLIEVSRPVALNGISELVTRGDLLDRCLVLYAPQIEGSLRRTEVELKREFERDRPLILGALYDAVAASLQNYEGVELESQPRLLDFAIRVTAAEAALGLQPGEFMQAYDDNRDMSHLLALEANTIGRLLCDFMGSLPKHEPERKVTALQLLEELAKRARDEDKRHQHWPANPKSLSDRLRRLQPHLKHVGVAIDFQRTGKGRYMTLTRLPGFQESWDQMRGLDLDFDESE